jgi:hypothetical protein
VCENRAFSGPVLRHQNRQRNEATRCVNESGIQNLHPREQGPQKIAKTDFEQELTEIPKERVAHPRIRLAALSFKNRRAR